jgi:catechol 2,3-dioxygenase-like lactoylglutathione lyase family enzyme
MLRLLFVVSLCVLAFLYGGLSVTFQRFPPQFFGQVRSAALAWRDVLWPATFYQFVDPEGAPTPQVVRPAEQDDGEYILMTGHPYALRSRCPEFGCMAWITDRSGAIHHSWEVDLAALWADSPHAGLKQHGRMAPAGLHLFDQGDLLASFQSDALYPYGIGMARFDKDGDVIWKSANFSHHKFSVAPDGRIYTPASKLYDSPLPVGDTRRSVRCPNEGIYSDVVLVLDPDGETIEEIDLFNLLIEHDFAGVLEIDLRTCDPIHLNDVEYVTEEMAAASGLSPGDLLISSRTTNMVAAIDGRTRAVKWAVIGRTVAQHSPKVMQDGGILVFDNRGGKTEFGGSRLVRLAYGRGDIETVYPRPDTPPEVDFWSEQQGVVDPHPDGRRVLVSLTEQGRLIELDLTDGEIVWELVNTHDPGPHAAEWGASDGDILRLVTLGAYYAGRPSFLTQ